MHSYQRMVVCLGAFGAGFTWAAALIRLAAERVPANYELKGDSLLMLATALHQLGDPGYAALLDIPLHDGRPYGRMDAARFVASTGEIANAALLLPLLDDRTAWDRLTVAEVALESLQRLTMEQLPPDAGAWQAWLDRNRDASRRSLVAAKLEARIAAVRNVPIWDANLWIGEFAPGDGPILFPLIDRYLRRQDLDARAIGPGLWAFSGGSRFIGQDGPQAINHESLRDVAPARHEGTHARTKSTCEPRSIVSCRALRVTRIASSASSPASRRRQATTVPVRPSRADPLHHQPHQLVGEPFRAGVAGQPGRLRGSDIPAGRLPVHPRPGPDRPQPVTLQPGPQHLTHLDHADLPETHPR